MTQPFNPRILTLAIATAIGSVALPAVAQGPVLEEIIVTAQKRQENIQDTPVAVTALSEDQLRGMGIDATQDVMMLSPMVTGYQPPTDKGGMSIEIRGIGNGDPSLSNDPANAIYVDGVYLGKTAGSSLELLDLERIEILRGPQGTLFGRNAVGGALNFVTKKPTGELGGRITATAGNYNLRKISGTVDLPGLGEVGEGIGRIAAKVDFNKETRDELYGNTNSAFDGWDDRDRLGYRLSLGWDVTEDVRIDYAYDHTELDELPVGQQVLPTTNPQFSFVNAVASGSRLSKMGTDLEHASKFETEGHTLTAAWIVGDIELKYIGAQREFEQHEYGDIDGFDSADVNVGFGLAPLPFWDIDKQANYEQRSHEIQITGIALDERLEFASGLYYFADKGDVDAPIKFFQYFGQFGPNVSEAGKREIFAIDNQAWAAYSQATFTPDSFDSRLRFTAGIRYTEEKKSIDFDTTLLAYDLDAGTGVPGADGFACLATINPAGGACIPQATLPVGGLPGLSGLGTAASPYQVPISGVTGTTHKENYDNVSWMANISYDLAENANIYFTVATGYRSGGYNGAATSVTGAKPFDEETLLSYELGAKTQWFDNRIRANLALWQSSYDDLQVASSQGATTLKVNAGEAERWGSELEITAALTQSLTANLSWAHTEGDFDKIPLTASAVGVCGGSVGDDGSDCAVRNSPDDAVLLSLNYISELADLGFLNVRLDGAWQSESAPQAFTATLLDERTIINGRVAIEEIELGRGTLEVAAWGRNLFDQDYKSYVIPLGFDIVNFGDPRTYGIDVSYNF